MSKRKVKEPAKKGKIRKSVIRKAVETIKKERD